ncbi:hypothetical protein BO71DRAFT_404565 [Aspergillus ellipticus CBS 707.79]|uniref:Uncharacterized protein n=1 Tax=Aspergillus ellipticus CBS 707.79 TaxID=1448320 RepID=A0A319CYU5_9EURO|nr:hypothetical protein BO71DRAFT_404565 [Aspergillus ellipticus CBS 707.79]
MPHNQTPQPQPRVIMDAHLRRAAPGSGSRPPRPGAPGPGVTDIRQTKEYKALERRWISAIVALPILMYTSWILYDRTYGGKSPKRLPVRGVETRGSEGGEN